MNLSVSSQSPRLLYWFVYPEEDLRYEFAPYRDH